jgi:rubrerythrin
MTIIEFARGVEGRGEEAFRRLARNADQPGVKRILDGVADDELALAAKIDELRAGLGASAGLEAVMLERLGKKVTELTQGLTAARVGSDIEAFDLAADYEEQVCQLFSGAAEQEANPETGSLLRRIGALECREAEDLRRAHDFINAPNEFLAWGEFSNLEEFHNFGRDVD